MKSNLESLEDLRQCICANSLVKNYIGDAHYSTWKRGHFIGLAKIIENSLQIQLTPQERSLWMSSLSSSTLERIFKYNYDMKEPIELRMLKTLNKLARFVGYHNWQGFRNNYLKELTIQDVRFLIFNAIQAEFSAYKSLPHLHLVELFHYFSTQGSAFLRIQNILERNKTENRTIGNEANPSTFELLEIHILERKDDEVHIKTKEYWYLRWYNFKEEKYDIIYNNLNEQLYIIAPENNQWKIRVNYYPSNGAHQFL